MVNEIEYPINLLVVVIGAFLCVTLGIFLLFNKSAKNNANLFLGSLVLVCSCFFIQGTLYRFHLLEQFPYLTGIGNTALFLIGPFAYFYVRACTQKGFHLTPIDGLHLLPFFINFLMDVPQFLLPADQKIEAYVGFVNTGNLPYQPDWMVVVKSLHGIAYFVVSTRLILQYRKHLNNETSAIDATFHRWMLFFVILLALPLIIITVYANFGYNRIFIALQLSSFLILLLGIYAATLVKPELFHTFPHQMLLPASSEEEKQKYERSKLQPTQKEAYLHKLQTYVQEHKPFLQPDLSLAQLSEQVEIPTHHLSQVINEQLDCNFLDFINSLRVEEAKSALTDPKFSHYTIMAAAYEAGFSAKSTFYSVFKKHTGMTPSQFRKQAKVAA